MGLICGDVVTFERNCLNEFNASGRFADSQLIAFTDRAAKKVMRAILWPQSRVFFNTIAGVQEYQLSEILRIKRVYAGGQPIVPTDIDTLEGIQVQRYDQTANGAGPGGLNSPNAPPTLVTSGFAPQWTSQPAETYPVSNGELGAPAPDAQSWYPGRRPAYYFRSGYFGLVPPPAGISPVVIDCVRQPTTLTGLGTALLLPDIALDTVAYESLELAFASDREQSGAADLRGYFAAKAIKALGEVKAWARGYDGPQRRGPKVRTYRSQYAGIGNHRTYYGD